MKIFFLDILTGNQKVRKEINLNVYRDGTYSESARKAFGLKKKEWFSVDASKEKFPKDFSGFNALVISGSTEDPLIGFEKRWMKKTYKFIKLAVKENIPILGICGGLQFTVRALGGEIITNPQGRQLGTKKINLTVLGQKDLLFKGLPQNSFFQSSHKYIVKNFMPGWKRLALSPYCQNQAIAIGNKIRLVQFHLELKQRELKAIALLRKQALIKEGFVKNENDFKKFINSIKNTERTDRKVLKNFLNYFIST